MSNEPSQEEIAAAVEQMIARMRPKLEALARAKWGSVTVTLRNGKLSVGATESDPPEINIYKVEGFRRIA